MKLPQALKPILHPILSRTPVGDADRYLLELDLGRGVSETPPTNPLQALTKMHTPQLRTLVSQLKKAAADDAVVGLIAQIAAPPLTLAQSGELRDAVATFRETGKPTLVFSPSFGELTPGTTGYHLASAFEEIWLQPSGAVGLVGFAGEAMTVRGTLDLLQVEPQFGQRHEFKTAADTFMAHEITDPHREMLTRLLVSATDTVVADVAHGRRLTTDHVRAIIDGGPLGAAAAQRAGLIDKIGYRDEAYAAIRSRLSAQPGGRVPEPELRYVERWGAGPFDTLLGGGGPLPSRKPVIALVAAAGPIATGRPEGRSPFGGSAVASDALCSALRAAGNADRVKAVVLRVDSPGGSYVASDQIRREVLVLREKGIPVVASMGSVAASGGYFIAMPADRIVANPGTITGSIGVLAGKMVTRAAAERIGVLRETIAPTAYSAMFSANRRFDEAELELLDRWLDEVYADFTAKAAADRKLPVEQLREVAKGRVWTGADAAERGLVDVLGGLDRALEEAARLGGVSLAKAEVRALPKMHPLQALSAPKSSEAVETRWGSPALTAGLSLSRGLLHRSGGLTVGLEQAFAPLLESLFGGETASGLGCTGVLALPPLRLPGLLT